MSTFCPTTSNTSPGSLLTTQVALSATAVAALDMPALANDLRVDFSGSSLVIQFYKTGTGVPTADATKGLTYQLSAVEVITVPSLAGGTSVAVSGTGTVNLCPGVEN
jgi:hypothetical protein